MDKDKKELMIFNNEEFGNIRFVEVDGVIFAVGNDVASVLGYTSPKDAITRHCKGATTYRYLTNGGYQDIKIISEGDIYRLIIKAADQNKNSEMKVKATKFEKWVFDEVLPSIRKHDVYMTDETIEKTLADPDFIIKLATELKIEKQKRLNIEQKLLEQQPKVEGFNQLIDSTGLYNMKEVADAFGMCGRNTLMKALRNENVLSDNESNKNLPYSQYSKAGLFRVKVTPRRTSNGVEYVSTTLCTPKSFKLIQKVLDKNRDLLQK